MKEPNNRTIERSLDLCSNIWDAVTTLYVTTFCTNLSEPLSPSSTVVRPFSRIA